MTAKRELKPLTTPDQRRHVQMIVRNYVKAVEKAEYLQKQYIEAKEYWEAKLEDIEAIRQEISKYVGKQRPTVAVIIEEGAFVIRDYPKGETATIRRVVSVGGGNDV
jgi:hypothetical protein